MHKTNVCPDCGARWAAGESCQAAYEEMLALEFSDPGYGQVHLLTVACFMIQHRRYSDRALAWMRDMLRAYLKDGQPVEELRAAMGRAAGPKQRDWKVERAADDAELAPIRWTMTILDVWRGQQDAASYRRLVTEWARVTLDEMGVWLRGE
jgi:hypothetical protein